ncbi:uncharacterized protein PGTG_16881 [Puccinia graminis f. sp. tritici CRL 75-36-700-3]|uniref:Uncharacterized protein n=1 Tax=Puccinia graminis f. sp. tritici (strain CRL 75-36-700-3 / race SCCL) TaxID=418459 RepID=E3L3L1_PUCGT|nr:uncharacterized protein PGTG_16881 [Puccinia graminis f. sp. tritici CRL 75-36-700-3]EFP91136.1 hypothetical protein PGTG_16881 [Puccinia graminis f. sp. tritici CRL 75-36-700-3]
MDGLEWELCEAAWSWITLSGARWSWVQLCCRSRVELYGAGLSWMDWLSGSWGELDGLAEVRKAPTNNGETDVMHASALHRIVSDDSDPICELRFTLLGIGLTPLDGCSLPSGLDRYQTDKTNGLSA